MDNQIRTEATVLTSEAAEIKTTPTHNLNTLANKEEILYNLLYIGKISMEEYHFLLNKKIEGSLG